MGSSGMHLVFLFFLHGFQACYQRRLSVIYHRLKGFWLRGPWKCEWPQTARQIRQFQKLACAEPVLSIPSTRSAQICWGRSMVAVLFAKLCWAWGTVWITEEKACVHADTGWALADHISMRLDGEESTPQREVKAFSLWRPKVKHKNINNGTKLGHSYVDSLAPASTVRLNTWYTWSLGHPATLYDCSCLFMRNQINTFRFLPKTQMNLCMFTPESDLFLSFTSGHVGHQNIQKGVRSRQQWRTEDNKRYLLSPSYSIRSCLF